MRIPSGSLLRKSISVAAVLVSVWAVMDGLRSTGLSDIQDPPSNVHGPIRKLSRGLSNIAFAGGELVAWTDIENEQEGNSAAAIGGPVRGLVRCLSRIGVGVYEVLTFPAPSWKGSYAPVEGSLYRSALPWVSGGFEEFPPELGFETRLPYARVYNGTSRLP
jgi:putative exosortase-associated protein (TIGR04073 family)